MDIELIRQVVWLNFRLTLVFAIALPLGLLLWAFLQKNQPIKRSLNFYWQNCSLLGITEFLLVASIPLGYITGWLARLLIVVSLWFWEDINQNIVNKKGILRFYFRSWRWAITVYCGLSNIWGLLFLPCAFTTAARSRPTCQALSEVPLFFKATFLPSIPMENLGLFGIATLVVFSLYFGSFLAFGLPRQGRIALKE